MKRVGNLLGAIADVGNLGDALNKACRGKRQKRDVIAFNRDTMSNLNTLVREISECNVKVGNYRYFTITDPKKRLICAADFSERVLHHAIMNICHPYFERMLIPETYASRIGKGLYAALDHAGYGMRKYEYVAKLDVRKFYDSIRHDVLKDKLARIFKDKALLSIFDRIIDSYSASENRGLPIGNLTSQYFANLFLSDIDHKMKEVRRVPLYARYMDDILLFRNDRGVLKEDVRYLAGEAEKIGLTLKPAVFVPTRQGVSFLGYRLFPHKRLLERRSKERYARKVALYVRYLNEGEWTEEEFREHIVPLTAFVEKAYTKHYRQTIIDREMADWV